VDGAVNALERVTLSELQDRCGRRPHRHTPPHEASGRAAKGRPEITQSS
jgi:hypothetical protein